MSKTKVLPQPGKRNILITSALPYVNNVPHLGNIIGAVLSADVYARYCRQRGYNALYICGTDEYGTATETKALEEKVTPQEICDKYYKIHKQVYEWFNISFDHFGRTSTQHQTKIAQDIFMKLHEKNLTIEETVKQHYCEKCKHFLADRFIRGTCPICQYEDAGGDQCDKCGKLLNSTDLLNPKCQVCGSTPIIKSSNHLFLDLPKLQPKIEKWKKESMEKGLWSSVAKNITNAWLTEGLKPRCITRDLKWGTPVPLENYKDKVFYVWFDAPIGYISITANYTEDWEKWWKPKEKVELVQFMGKDNVPFHSVIFPATLIGTGENWVLVEKLSATEYLNYGDGKFSKRKGVGVFGDNVQETGIDSDIYRYYLLTNRPEQADSTFTWKDFTMKANNELLANLGNFINRGLKFCEKEFQGKVPPLGELEERENTLIKKINTLINDYNTALEKINIKDALHTMMAISKLGNQYFQEVKPWDLAKDEKTKPKCATAVNIAIQITRCLSALMEPYMPTTAQKILDQLNMKSENINFIHTSLKLDAVPEGHKIGKPVPLFPKLEDKKIKELEKRFGEKEEDIFDLDLRVGQIKAVENHPKADRLYKLSVDIGAGKPKNIVGGLKEAYPDASKLVDKKVIVVCNLKVAKLQGEKSEGMLLAANLDKKVSLLTPEKDVPVGSKVAPKGAKLVLKKVVKKKELENTTKELKTVKGGVATFKTLPLQVLTEKEPVIVVAENRAENAAIY